MSRISALFVLLVVCGAVHGNEGHGSHGKPFGKGKGFMGMMSPEQETVMCKDENKNDDKFDQYRAELEKCFADECTEQVDDIGTITKPENKMMARMHCSKKFKECREKPQGNDGDGEGEEGSDDNKGKHDAWIKKMEGMKVSKIILSIKSKI